MSISGALSSKMQQKIKRKELVQKIKTNLALWLKKFKFLSFNQCY